MAESEKRLSKQTQRETDKQKSEKNPRLYDNLPTEGRKLIIESFLEENPVIDRTADVYGFIKKLSLLKKGKCNVIALDGKWGCGKSTFVGHTILLKTLMFDDVAKQWGVDYKKQDLPDLDKWIKLRERCENICKKCKEQGDSEDGKINLSLANEYLYYDAWKNDSFDGEPILSIIYNLFPEVVKKTWEEKCKEFIENRVGNFVTVVGSVLAGLKLPSLGAATCNAIGSMLLLFGGIIKIFTDNKNNKIKNVKQAFIDPALHEKIRKNVEEIIPSALKVHEMIRSQHYTMTGAEMESAKTKEETRKRFIIFIDELDRCNPLFAVRVLERVKHFFDNDKLVFVFSVNLEQLQHTIKKVYGHDFDAIHYVHRFFTEQDELPIVDMSLFIENQLFGKKKTEKSKDEQKGAENE